MLKKLLNKIFKTDTHFQVRLPAQFRWDKEHEKLYCQPCYPSHTVPIWFYTDEKAFLKDSNVHSFIVAHKNCTPHKT